ncbi:MAG: hypothetical protein CL608_03460 [Anaerolineaceae bacterium]|nr:hypothetical protein [Anaerolineaceae bacterium]
MYVTDHRDDLLDAVPNLRRYAFCIVGRQDEGDALVERVLHNILSDGVQLTGSSCSVCLFKAFNTDRSVNTACRNAAKRNSWTVEDGLHGEILSLPVRLRQILILVRTIGFSREATAEIVACPTADIAVCLNGAVDRMLQNARPHQARRRQRQEAVTREPPQNWPEGRVPRYGT